MTTFTLTSWDNTNPEQFDAFNTAVRAGLKRAEAEKSLVKLASSSIGMSVTISPDTRLTPVERLGNWQFTERLDEEDVVQGGKGYAISKNMG